MAKDTIGENVRRLTKFFEQLFITVLDRYDLSPGSEEVIQTYNLHRGIVNPQIVLNQSFS